MMLSLRYLSALTLVSVAFLVSSSAMTAPAATSPPPSTAGVTVVGATDGTIALTLTGPSSTAVLTLRQEEGSVRSIRVGVTPFRSPGGDTYATRVKPTTVTFSSGLATVRLSADLPFGGPYTAQMSLGQGTAATRITVSVTRSRGTAPFTVDGVATTNAVSDGLHWQDVTRTVTITETTGRLLALEPPAVVAPSATFAGQTVEADVRVKRVHVVGDTTGCRLSELRLTVSPNRTCQLALELQVPAAAGSYGATIRYVTPGYAPVDQAATVQLRRPWWWALLAIAFGVALAAILRLWLRPRTQVLDAQIEVARAREDLDTAVRNLPHGLADTDEQNVVIGMYAVLDEVDKAARSRDADAAARRESARGQIRALPAWVDLHRALAAVAPAISEAYADEFKELTSRMTAVDVETANASSLLKDLKDFRDELAKVGRERAEQRAERLEQAINELSDLDQVTLAFVRSKVSRAKDNLKLPGDAAQARADLTDAEQKLADTFTLHLRTFIAQDVNKLGFPASADWWRSLRGTLSERLDSAQRAGEERLELLRAVETDLLRELSDQLRRAVDAALIPKAEGPNQKPELPSPSEEDKKKAAAIEEELKAVAKALHDRDLGTAHTAYANALQQWRAWKRPEESGDQFLGRADLDSGRPALLTLRSGVDVLKGMPVGEVEVSGRLPEGYARSALERKRRINQGILIAGAFVVAVLAGLLALYVGKSTWGSAGDLLLAVLWGLGITAGAQGFANVQQTLTA